MINFKIFKNITFTGLILIGISACDTADFLEKTNKTQVTDATLWAGEGNADLALNYVYGLLPNQCGDALQLEEFTDNSIITVYYTAWNWKNGIINAPNTYFGDWSGQCGPAHLWHWQQTYSVIRRLNVFIQKVNENAVNFSEEYLGKRIDEARFLRAFFYSELFMRVGGLSIITVPQDRTIMTEDELYIPRSTFEETLKFLVDELTDIVNNGNLPVKYNQGDPNAGRATLGAALALKGWLQLFAASPAYNSSSPAVPNSDDNKDLQSFASPDPARWAAAAATNKQFIDTYGHLGSGEYGLFPRMSEFWWEENEYNSEVVWERQHVTSILPNRYNEYGGPLFVDGRVISWGNYNPTQDLIDEYQMADGKDINDPTSGYDDQNPYVGREKRFYDFIVYDGAPYYQAWMPKPETIYTRIDKVNPSPNQIDFEFNDQNHSGYWCIKKLDHLHASSNEGGMNQIYYRYAEVVLNYAEAQNEAVGPDASVYEAINAIRTRPGTDLPELQSGLSKDQMREAIYHERRIELAFENKRLFDLWRLKNLEALNADPKGMKIYNSVPNDNSGVWVYEPFSLGELGYPHNLEQKQYFNPIPQTVIERNNKIKQNWGY
jgi:starch-binding outer membrane protein, SusD/RagB family